VIYIGLYTGNREIDSLIDGAHAVLFYGIAGSGKTSMLMTIAGNHCRGLRCLYISTEETLHYERVVVDEEKYSDVLFTEVYDFDKLLDLATFIYLNNFNTVFVDSLNALFRLQPLREGSLSRFAYIVASLRKHAEEVGGKLFASAQVRGGDGEEIVGKPVLEYYFDVVVNLGMSGGGKRYARVIKPESDEYSEVFYFTIGERGVEWI